MDDDQVAYKGTLYTKIDLSSIGKGFLHLFNFHTQSSNPLMSDRILVESFVCRYEQIKETRQYMQRRVFGDPKNYNKDTDLVMLTGDTNVCSLGNYISSAKMHEF